MILRTNDGKKYNLVPFEPRAKSGGTRKMFGALWVAVNRYRRGESTDNPTQFVRYIRADTIVATTAMRPLPELIKLRHLRDLDYKRMRQRTRKRKPASS